MEITDGQKQNKSYFNITFNTYGIVFWHDGDTALNWRKNACECLSAVHWLAAEGSGQRVAAG